MNYSELPIFKGITPEAAAYIDRFDNLIKKYNNNHEKQATVVQNNGEQQFEEKEEQ